MWKFVENRNQLLRTDNIGSRKWLADPNLAYKALRHGAYRCDKA